MTDPRLEAYIERLVNDPQFVREVEEFSRKWKDLVARAQEGDEEALAEINADQIDLDALRAKYVGQASTDDSRTPAV